MEGYVRLMNYSAKTRTFKKIRYFGFGFGIGRNKKGMFRCFLVSAEIKKGLSVVPAMCNNSIEKFLDFF